MDYAIILTSFVLIAVISFVVWGLFILTPEIQEARQAVVSFCQCKGFTDFEYTDEYSFFRYQGFCYKEVNGYLEKQSFFINQQKTVLMVDE